MAFEAARLDPLNPFGESIDLNRGTLSLRHVDVSIPGNSELPVEFARRYEVDGVDYSANVLGGWIPDIPVITARAVNEPSIGENGWTPTRCTGSHGEGRRGFDDDTLYSANGYWSGATMHIPGEGGQLILENPPSVIINGDSSVKKTTTGHWRIQCLSQIDNGSGEGFIATSPNGTKYFFDYMTVTAAGTPDMLLTASEATTLIGAAAVGNTPCVTTVRGCYWPWPLHVSNYNIWASRIEDPNGNWVEFDWTNGRLESIHSNDGRLIDIVHDTANGTISSVVANGRSWSFTYYKPSPSHLYHSLTDVILPDGRRWSFDLEPQKINGPSYTCWAPPAVPEFHSVTNPNGVVGVFELNYFKNGVSGVPQSLVVPPTERSQNPLSFTDTCDDYRVPLSSVAKSVVTKTVTGPGFTDQVWRYEYEAGNGYTDAAGQEGPAYDWKKRTVIDPLGDKTDYYYNRRHQHALEGLLVKEERRDGGSGAILESTTFDYITGPNMGDSTVDFAYAPPKTWDRPIRMRTTSRGSDVYNTRYTYNTNLNSSSYSFGSPTKTESWSNIVSAMRVTDTTYEHNTAKWILSQPKTVTRNGKLFDTYHYDGLGQVTQHDRFGALYKRYEYKTDGTLDRVFDALNRRTYLGYYKRGIPERILRPDDVWLYRTVDDNGWVTSQTNARGYTTNYEYNSVGWLTKIDRPSPWSDTNISYQHHSGGVNQTAVRGPKETKTYHDGLMRPIRYREWAQSNGGGLFYVSTSYDALGRETFKSFPSTQWSSTTGVETTYDALGRVTQTRETVAPNATTTTAYLTDNRVRITDPEGDQTTTTRSGYGSPDDGNVTLIQQPEGVTTAMTYDIYGNILTARQYGSSGGFNVDE
ncbi:MAG: hypothetical protein AAGJ87_10720, partial [Pseudomonadota bacterium]